MGYGSWPDSGKMLCSYNPDTQTCDAEDYFTTIALEYLLTGLILGLAATLTAVVTYLLYALSWCKCCQVCAWYGCSHYLVKGKYLKRYPATKKFYNILFHRARLYRVMSVAISMIIIVFLFVILGVEIKVETATATFRTRSQTFLDRQAEVLEKGINRLMGLPSVSMFESASLRSAVNRTREYIKDFRDQNHNLDRVRDAELGKFIPEMVFLAILISLAGCGIMISLWGQRTMLLIYGACLIIVILPIFLYWASSAGLETFYRDVCQDNDVSRTPNGNSALKYGIIGCNGTGLTNLRQTLDRIYREIEVKACVYTQRVCVQPNVFCPATTCTLPNLPRIIERTGIVDALACGSISCPTQCGPGQTQCYVRNMSLPLCTIACKNPNLNSLATRARLLERDSILYTEYHSRVFEPVAQCDFVDSWSKYIDRPLCKDMMMIGVAGVFTLLVGILFIVQYYLVLAMHMSLEKKEKTMFEMAYHPDKSASE